MWDGGIDLWDGDGDGVYCLHASRVAVAVRVLSYCVVSCGMAVVWVRVCGVSLSVFPCFFVFLSSSCVGVRGSARAALRARTLSPNTIVFPVVVLSCLLFASRLSSAIEWRWCVFTMCLSVRWA